MPVGGGDNCTYMGVMVRIAAAASVPGSARWLQVPPVYISISFFCRRLQPLLLARYHSR